jgi:hypothetical protein
VHGELGQVGHEAKKGALAWNQTTRAILVREVTPEDSRLEERCLVFMFRQPASVVTAEVYIFEQEGGERLRHERDTSPTRARWLHRLAWTPGN